MPISDLSLIRKTIGKYSLQGRSALLPALHDVQKIHGYIPADLAAEVANVLDVPLSDVFGVIEFYALFYNKPVGKTVVHVCNDPACSLAGADSIFKRMTQRAQKEKRSSDAVETITVERSPCLGLCEHAPALHVQGGGGHSGQANDQTWEDLVANQTFKHPKTFLGGEVSILTANCRGNQPTWLETYLQTGGYQGLRKALSLPGESVIEEVKLSGLVGRGGAAFPTGLKWESAAKTPADKRYVVCNGDEAEPGTFKDRVLMENDPHRILEGLIITAYAIGASQGYIYIRGEYTYPFQIMEKAVREAIKAGMIGTNIQGSNFDFRVEIRSGAGAYICGEETALFESIEGKRGFPRIKPPYPTTAGLFGKPTVINNVETLCNIPYILHKGADCYRTLGTHKSPGSKLFCLSGDVTRPGLYEVPFGVSFRHVLVDLAGGVRDNRKMQAALFGGAAGAFATEDNLDVNLSFEEMREAGLPLGAGVITVFDQSRDMRDILFRLSRFFMDESCGKCFPCQLGTQRQFEIIKRIYENRTLPGDKERLLEIGTTMRDTSLCGLGQTASMAVNSAIERFPELFS